MHYGVPYQWGPNVLMYNTDVFKEAPKSWNVVFEEMTLPDGKSNKGRVQAYDGPIYVADAALYLMAHKPELGIKDPYELNEDQYKAALDLLRAAHAGRSLLARRHDADGRLHQRRRGRIRLLAVPGQPAADDKQPDRLDLPEEGATGWADTTMMHAEAAIRTAPICGWSIRCLPRCRAISPPGSARCRPCPPPARATRF